MSVSEKADIITLLRMYQQTADVDGLKKIVQGPYDTKIKKRALMALGSLKRPDALDVLGGLLEMGRSELSEYAMGLLMDIPGPEALDAMAKGLSSGDDPFRLWVLRALSTRKEPQALRWVLHATKDGCQPVRRMAFRIAREAARNPERLRELDEESRKRLKGFLGSTQGRGRGILARLRQCGEGKDVAGLAKYLCEDFSPQIQKTALEIMARIGTPEALDQIGSAIASCERQLAEHGLRVLMELPGDESVRAMAKGLRAGDPAFRSYVLITLSRRPEPQALREILRAAKDENPQIASAAISILRDAPSDMQRLSRLDAESLDGIFSFLDPRVVPGFLSDEYPDTVRLAVIRWMANVEGDDCARTLVSMSLKEDIEFRQTALSSLESMESFTKEIALPLLRAPFADTRRRGVWIYARQCGPGEGKAIKALVADEDAGVRRAALGALIERVGAEALDEICSLVADVDADVRFDAVSYLCGLDDDRVLPFLALAARDPKDQISRRAIFSLAIKKYWDPELEGRILELLEQGLQKPRLAVDESDGFCAIIRLMEEVKAAGAMSALVTAARSLSIRLRRVAGEAIDRYPMDLRTEMLSQLVDTEDKSLLRRVAMGLGQARDSRAVAPLIRVVEECGGRAAKRALKLLRQQVDFRDLDFLIRTLRLKWPSVKIFIAREMEKLSSPRFIDPLLNVLDEEDVEVQIAVVQALKNFADVERVSKRLVEIIGFGDLSLRQVVIETIGEAAQRGKRIEEAVEPLTKCLGNRFLRKKAEEALKRLGNRKGLLAIKRRKIRDSMIPKPPKPSDLDIDSAGVRRAAVPRLRYA